MTISAAPIVKTLTVDAAIRKRSCRQVGIHWLVALATMISCLQLNAEDRSRRPRVGLVVTPVLFTRSYGPFSIERGGGGLFVARRGGDFTGAVEASVYGSNSPIETFKVNLKLGLFADMCLIAVDSSVAIGPEAGLQFTMPFVSSHESNVRIVLGIITHVPLGSGVLDIGFRVTPFGTFSGISGDGTSSKYGLVLRYGLSL